MKNLFNQLLRFNDSNFKIIIIFKNNQGVIIFVKNAQFYIRIKHINIAHHFMREKINNNIMNVQYIFINKQIIYNLIKTLYFDKFIIFRDALEMKTILYYLFKII